MPPRFAYWTIILDGVATSFRAHDRDEILPTFNQLKKKDPAALLKWFSGGKLWDSPEQAKELRALERVRTFREERKKEASESHGEHGPAQGPERGGREDPLAEFRRQHGRPADGSDDPSLRGGGADPRSGGAFPPRAESRGAAPDRREFRGAPPRGPRRDRDWRPGGEHKDPRDKYKLPPGEARKRWKERNLGPRVPKPFGGGPGGDRPFGDRPRGARPFGSKPGSDRPFGDRPRGPKPFGSKPGGDRPFGDRPRGPKPFGSKPGGDRPFGDRPRGPKPFGSKPGGDRPFRGKPSGPGGPRPSGPRPFDHRPPRGPKPFGGKPRGPGRRGPK